MSDTAKAGSERSAPWVRVLRSVGFFLVVVALTLFFLGWSVDRAFTETMFSVQGADDATTLEDLFTDVPALMSILDLRYRTGGSTLTVHTRDANWSDWGERMRALTKPGKTLRLTIATAEKIDLAIVRRDQVMIRFGTESWTDFPEQHGLPAGVESGSAPRAEPR